MRKSSAITLCSLAFVLLTAMPMYATDCSAGVPQGSGGGNWVDFSAEDLSEQKTTWDCWSVSNLTNTTLSANSWYMPGVEVRGLSAYAIRSFVVPANQAGHYTVSMWVELIDPHADYYNQLTGSVSVYHPATSTTTWYSIYYHNGTQGNDYAGPYADFTGVAVGDTITIYISGAWSFDSDSHTRFTSVHLQHPLNF